MRPRGRAAVVEDLPRHWWRRATGASALPGAELLGEAVIHLHWDKALRLNELEEVGGLRGGRTSCQRGGNRLFPADVEDEGGVPMVWARLSTWWYEAP